MISNSEIASKLDEAADLLELQDGNPFRIRACRNAARTVSSWPAPLERLRASGHALPKMPGIGKDLAGKIAELLSTQQFALLQELRKKTPSSLVNLLKIPGLGPKRIRVLRDRLQIASIQDLAYQASQGRIRSLPGFGVKSEAQLLAEAKQVGSEKVRIKFIEAQQLAAPLVEYLKGCSGLTRLEVAGSFRRKCETVGDLDILATGPKSVPLMDHFRAYESIQKVVSFGPTRATAILKNGIQVDLRWIPDESFGAALHYFTGSKFHNIAIRRRGVQRGLKINEYGIFRGARRIGGAAEPEVFKSVGLPYIEPELREARGEIEAAEQGRLPKLITLGELRGDLHSHTLATDGHHSITEMAQAAASRGHRYLAITDHSRRLGMAHGLDVSRLRQQLGEIDRLNQKNRSFRILKGIEVDILKDGSLDLPAEVLRELDLVIASVHSHFSLGMTEQTDRILKAMDHPCVSILGHPTGRLIGSRRPYEMDIERVLRGAMERGCAIEINSQPQRLDLPDLFCKLGKEIGVKFAISTDAHDTQDLGLIQYGVSVARRG